MSNILPFPSFNLPFLQSPKKPWWIQIKTQLPDCIYYFGPFDTKREAQLAQSGYFEDLSQEKAQGIAAQIQQFSPAQLTVERTS